MIKFKEFYEKYLNTKGLVVILIIGMALLFFPSRSPSDEAEKKSEDYEHSADLEDYEKALERKLSSMLATIKGAGKVDVMITFSDYGRYVYSQEEQSERSESSTKGNQKPVLKNSSSGNEEPILIKAELPSLSGVFITAEGADDPVVRENITAAVKAVLNISSKNISVLPK